jgi:hypothetical protein
LCIIQELANNRFKEGILMTVKSYKLSWEPSDPATPALLEPLLDDTGLGEDGGKDELEAREAAKKYLAQLIREQPGDWTMGMLSTTGESFYEGYLRGIRS